MNSQKVENQENCHAEPCAELDSVLIQHLTESMTYETLNQVQGDKSRLFTRPPSLQEKCASGEKEQDCLFED
jgi:hypothetical protein